jgi:hypothetical protein
MCKHFQLPCVEIRFVASCSNFVARFITPALNNNLQTDVNNLSDWSAKNKMVLNEQKMSKSMSITGKRLVNLDGKTIQNVESYKLLGVTLYIANVKHILTNLKRN